ncbi:glycoside hydrolase family 3 N-terminal domain-containing protein [Chelatococcus reniformis]|nr:glycoside hydrolase family 3 N-terminal domain-containing protein [Chelatococcus reniformis]
MTVEEKIGQLNMVSADAVITGPAGAPDGLEGLDRGGVGSVLNIWGDDARALQRIATETTRLGIPLIFGLDVLHGHRTVFPIPLAEAASFDDEVWRQTAVEAAREAAEDAIALTFAPMLDVSHDPRWGRISESCGEDPLVTERVARAKVRGYQGSDLGDPRTLAATAKHFAGYGAVAGGRDYDAADISDAAMRTVYLPPFRAAVEAGVAAVMPAFISVAGIPMTAHLALLRGELRDRWGFEGITVSDYNAVAELIAHGAAETGPEAAALALASGNDIDMVSGLYVSGLPGALSQGSAAMEDLDEAVLRILRLKERLGLFDDPTRPCPPSSADDIDRRRQIAREAARRSAVLLTNPGDLLPLQADLRRIAVVGPLAVSKPDMLGPWAGTGDPSAVVTFAEGILAAWPDAEVEIVGVGDRARLEAEAVEAARGAQAVILCLGETAAMSGEAAARADPSLPAGQQALLDAVLATGTPTVVLLSSGRPLVAPALFAAPCAVLATWFLGSEAGHAVADLLSGAAGPSGKLPVAWPRAVGQIPVHYAHPATGRPHEAGNRYTVGYADLAIEPQFPFGHGLSYGRVRYHGLSVAAHGRSPDDPVEVEVGVSNDGARPARETVLVFAHVRVQGTARPLLALRDFAGVEVPAGASTTVTFRTSRRALTGCCGDEPYVSPSRLEVVVGPSAAPEGQLRARVEVPVG